MKMCQAFADAGHEVSLFAKNTTACVPAPQGIYQFYSVRKNFTLNIFPPTAFRGSGLWYNISLFWRVMRLDSDLIYTRSIIAAFFLVLQGKRLVLEVHEPFEGKGYRLRKMFRYVVQSGKLRKLVVISEALKAYYTSDYGLDSDLLLVAHDGADPFEFTQAVLGGERLKVGYVGSLYSGKGMETILPLAAVCPEMDFHIVGGNRAQIDDNAAKAIRLGANNVFFHGFKSQMDLPGYVSSFDIVLAPYTANVRVSDKKGANNLALWMSPLKIFEYMSASRAIIASDLPVIREILTHGRDAWLCPPGSISDWQEALKQLKEDGALRLKISSAAHALFLRRYTWSVRATDILKALS